MTTQQYIDDLEVANALLAAACRRLMKTHQAAAAASNPATSGAYVCQCGACVQARHAISRRPSPPPMSPEDFEATREDMEVHRTREGDIR